jgi:hypothetical protein
LFPAVPLLRAEQPAMEQIIRELEKLADGLRGFPPGSGGGRGPEAAKAIVASLKKINATLDAGTRQGKLGRAGLSAIGREFGKIGATLQAADASTKTGAKTTARKATKKTTRR